jgi:disulfide bond formation protein DsbB
MLVAAMTLLLYQSYQVLGIERYWFESSCTLSDPFPNWIPLHVWLPSIFEPWELCGYTPEIVKGVTMAEVLVMTAAISFALSIWHLINQIKSK